MKSQPILLGLALGASTLTFAQVGIGTSTPTVPLDIEAADAAIDINNTSTDPLIHFQVSGTTNFTIGTDVTDSKFKIGTTALETGTAVTVQPTGEVGIGTSTPAYKLDVKGAIYAHAQTDGGQVLRLQSNDVLRSLTLTAPANGDASAPFIFNTGNSFEFQVDGGNAFAISAINSVTINEDGENADFRVEGDTEVNLLFVDGSAEMVGIGTSTPAQKLHISDGTDATPTVLRIENTDGAIDDTQLANSIEFYTNDVSTNGTGISGKIAQVAENVGTNYGLAFYTYSASLSESMRISRLGYVGIGTSTPGYLLTVNGRPGANGYTAFTNYSDRRLKTNIDSLDAGALDKILQLNPVSFQYNDKYLQLYPESDLERVHKGFIAQEIQKVFPEMVSEMKESPDSVKYLDLDISHLQVYLVKALQEQQAIIEAQKAEIESLKAEASSATSSSEENTQKLDANTSEIEALKAQVQQLLQLIQQQESVSAVK